MQLADKIRIIFLLKFPKKLKLSNFQDRNSIKIYGNYLSKVKEDAKKEGAGGEIPMGLDTPFVTLYGKGEE
ncbi:hypothetical protein [Anabaena catenula]|uniref:Uncharacterized protein n=1 Tax=Anabaena catenula FACHB-362 TaxID=2692877 RepID=A0ABR8J0M1_9NOST|nr:hypothetical protein [Anabaena catenula]MBD2691130.1 hypothetical protein [Anabaena catenula FACHB-362]